MRAAGADERRRAEADAELDQVAARYEEVAAVLRDLDVEQLWAETTEDERRILVQDLVEEVAVLPDHLEVKIAGAPRLNVLLAEVGLKEKVPFCGVGGGI